MLGCVIQIDGFDPAANAPVTLRAASRDDARLCHLDGQTWWPTIAKLPTLRYDLFDGAFGGQITAPSASLTLGVEPWPEFGRYALADARIRLWTGEVGADWAAYMLRFDGRVSEQPALKDAQAQIAFAVDDRWLDTALLPTYAGTTKGEGPAALKGQVKPLAIGAPRYVAGTLVNAASSIFHLSHLGVRSVEAALERLARFGAPTADYATYEALDAAQIARGTWATCLAGGFVRFGAPTEGQVSFLVQGDASGPDGWVRLPGRVIRRLALLSGGAGRIDDASLAALDAARPYPLSIYLDAQTTARQLIQQVAASVNAVAGVSWTGQLFVVPVGLSAPTITLAADGSSMPPVGSVEQVGIAAPWKKLAIGAERAWTVHALSDIAFTVQLIDLGPYDAATTYREGNIVQSGGSTWLYRDPTPTKGNAPPALPIEENGFWRVLARAGANGADGTNGKDGRDGTNGTNGLNGTNGQSIHIAYANSADGRTDFTTGEAAGRAYIGVYTDTDAGPDSTDPTKYGWTLIRGADGKNGLPGPGGYAHIAYANSADGTVDFHLSDPTGRRYIGTYTDQIEADSTNPALYAWQLVKGADGKDGRDGSNGTNGQSIHIAYANSADGRTDFTTGEAAGRAYIGVYTDTDAGPDSTDPTKYGWTLIRGADGKNGLAGPGGYAHIAYANSADGRTDFHLSDPTGRRYIGTYTDQIEADSTNPALYAWQLVKGADGTNGRNSYIHYAYANSPDGRVDFDLDQPNGRSYEGTYTDFTVADSSDPAAYTWREYKGPPFGMAARGSAVVAGDTIVKNGGAAAWDSDAYSTVGYRGGCVVSFSAGQIGMNVMAGLNSDPTTDADYRSLDYAWYFNENQQQMYIYESSDNKGVIDNYDSSDLFQVRYDGLDKVEYLKNGAVRRTVTGVGPNRLFYFDSSIYTPGARLRRVAFTAAGAAGASGRDGAAGVDGFIADSDVPVFTIESYSSGAAKPSWSGGSGLIRLTKGGAVITAGVTYSIGAKQNIASLTLDGARFSFAGLTADVGYFVINAIYAGTAYSRVITVKKVRDGSAAFRSQASFSANSGSASGGGNTTVPRDRTVTIAGSATYFAPSPGAGQTTTAVGILALYWQNVTDNGPATFLGEVRGSTAKSVNRSSNSSEPDVDASPGAVSASFSFASPAPDKQIAYSAQFRSDGAPASTIAGSVSLEITA